MRSPLVALGWDIWQRNRALTCVVTALLLFSWLFNLALPESFRATEAARHQLLTLNSLLAVVSILFVFAMFNYTEFNRQKEWTGFPARLFALPIATWLLVTLPIVLGIAAVEMVFIAWNELVFRHGELVWPFWFGVLIGSYMVFYQAILWSLAGARILRILVLGLIGTSFVGVAFLPFFGGLVSSAWLSQRLLIPLLLALGCAGWASAWWSVAGQRSGGGRRRNWLAPTIDRALDFLPRRRKPFSSAAAAQFWFEWRRSGLLLPLSIAGLLMLVIGPLSWNLRNESNTTLWMLGWTLAMPLLLAMPIGKGFSKPDFWSADLAMPSFLAIRPLAAGERIVAKMKVAAWSAILAWFLVVAFIGFWFGFWADLEPLGMIRLPLWMIYGHSVYPQYAIAVLALLAAVCLTWKFMVNGLWVGLSGNRKWFVASATIYCGAMIAGLICLTLVGNNEKARQWFHQEPNNLVGIIEWILALAVIAKFWLAAIAWRSVSARRVRFYLLMWLGGTAIFVALALLMWADGTIGLLLMSLLDLVPLDVYRLRHLFLLAALLAIPIARLGLARLSIARNRQ